MTKDFAMIGMVRQITPFFLLHLSDTRQFEVLYRGIELH